jgi:hypothetical protein
MTDYREERYAVSRVCECWSTRIDQRTIVDVILYGAGGVTGGTIYGDGRS